MVALGIGVIVVSALWLLFWGFIELLALALGGDPSGWVLVTAALVVGVLGAVLGIALVRGRAPSRLGWIGIAAVIVFLVLVPLGQVEEEGTRDDSVDRAVEVAYVKTHGAKRADADGSHDDITNRTAPNTGAATSPPPPTPTSAPRTSRERAVG
jgi:hypothetical protein